MDMQAFDQVRQLAASHYLVRSLHIAAELGVADAVQGPTSRIGDVAARVGADPDALARVLRLLASRGIFRIEGGAVGHTPASDFMRSDHPASLRSFVRMFGQPIQWQSAGELRHAITTGEAVAPRVAPGGLWGYFESNPADGQIFGEAMVAKSVAQIADLLASHDFGAYSHIVDIGGGHGHVLRAILAKYHDITGTVFDLPRVVEDARQAGPNNRLNFVAGDFFTSELPSGDAMILMEILHDWDDERCRDILGAVRRAARPDTRLLVVEIEMTEGDGPDWPKLLDIVMLTVFAARQRSNSEYGRLIEASGFRVDRQTSTPGGLTIIEAVPT